MTCAGAAPGPSAVSSRVTTSKYALPPAVTMRGPPTSPRASPSASPRPRSRRQNAATSLSVCRSLPPSMVPSYPATPATAGVADLHQDRQRAPGRIPAQLGIQDSHAVRAVDVAVRLEAGVGGQLAGQPGDARGVGKLVRQQQPGKAE